MIVHIQPVEFFIRIFDQKSGDAAELVKQENPYQGSMVMRLVDREARVELATGCFDFAVYKYLRDEFFEQYGATEIRWKGNGRIQKPKQRITK